MRPRCLASVLLGAAWARAEGGTGTGPCPDSIHHQHFGVCRCECVLLDVGLNSGSSLTTWAPEAAQLPAASAAATRLQECAQSASTCYYGFEANPGFDERLFALERTLRQSGKRVKLFTGTAFNTHDQPTTFMVERHLGSAAEKKASSFDMVSTGSTLEVDKGMHYMDRGGRWHHNNTRKVSEDHLRFKRVTVPSTNATSFLAALHAHSGFVGAKIDIEGFEYTLFPDMLMRTPRVLCGLGALVIEWHEGMVPKFDGYTEHLRWFLTHPACNVTVVDWK